MKDGEDACEDGGEGVDDGADDALGGVDDGWHFGGCEVRLSGV